MADPLISAASPSWAHGLFKDLRKIVLATMATFVLACLVAVTVTPKYTSTATLLVLLSSEYSFRPDIGSDTRPNAVLDKDAILKSEIEILTSRVLEKEVLLKIGVDRLYPAYAKPPGLSAQLKAAIAGGIRSAKTALGMHVSAERAPAIDDLALAQFSAAVSAVADKEGNIITLGFHHTDPELAADVVNTLISLYLERRAELYEDSQTKLMADQVDALRTKLDTAQQKFAAFKASLSIADYDSQRQILLRQQAALSQDLQEADNATAQLTKRLATVEAQLGNTSPNVVLYSERDQRGQIDQLASAIQGLKIREAAVKHSYRDNSAQVTEIDGQIRAAQAELNSALSSRLSSSVRNGRSALYDALEIDRANAKQNLQASAARHDTDMRQLAQVTESIRELESSEVELLRLDREKTLLDQSYRSASQALSDRRILETVLAKKHANIRVIEPAQPPIDAGNTRALIFALGVMLSLFAGVLVAVLSQVLRRGYLAPENVEQTLGVPVLAVIPNLRRNAPPLLDFKVG